MSDTHIGPRRDDTLYETATAPRLERLVRHLNEQQDDLDFVVHTGDVARDPKKDNYRLAAEILSELEVPLYLCNGNHDAADLMAAAFPRPGNALANDDTYSYWFELADHRFIVLDGRGPDSIDPHGRLDTQHLDALSTLLRQAVPTTVFIHFPALPLDCAWVDRMMMLENGDVFHRCLAEHAATLCGVFFGHVHRSTQTLVDGVFYASTASSFCQFQNAPRDEQMYPAHSPHAFYNLATVQGTSIRVRQYFC